MNESGAEHADADAAEQVVSDAELAEAVLEDRWQRWAAANRLRRRLCAAITSPEARATACQLCTFAAQLYGARGAALRLYSLARLAMVAHAACTTAPRPD